VHKRRQQDWQRMAFGGGTASRFQREAQAAAGPTAAGAMAASAAPAAAPPGPAQHSGGNSRFDRDSGVSGSGAAVRTGTARVPSFGESRSFGPVTIPGSATRTTRQAPDLSPVDSAFGRAPTAPIPLVTQELPVRPLTVAPAPRSEPAAERTEVLPASVRLPEAESHSRDVSIEELIDLEQQAEFFVVLGQDDAAIELLVEHLRATGGGSPLPYLKLLEIHRRRGEQAAYERTRSRFNQRFNAYAPEWGSDLAAGRALESYPGVLPRLEQVWARPLDAMAELEALLFRKSRGDLFELPAYREVLFLYALARDLLDREAANTGNVDLLLPLSDGGEFGPTTPRAYLGLDAETRPGGLSDGADGPDSLPPPSDFADLGNRPTAPLDLEVGVDPVGERRNSIFDPFDDRPAPSRG
jgi:hypothetical protein